MSGSTGSTADHDHIGRRVPRREDGELLTGRARTVADLDLPGTLELAFRRSELASARLGRVDTAAASALEGVVGAWSAEGLPGLPDVPAVGRGLAPPGMPRPALATGRVRFAGETIAVVAATSRAAAEDAAELVTADLEPLPVLLDPRSAAEPGAPEIFDGAGNVATEQWTGSPPDDLDDAFAGAAVVVEGRYREQLLLPSSLEGRAVLVRPDDDGGVTVWVSHQAQHQLRSGLAGAFDLPEELVRVVVPATGGAFGAKSQLYPEYLVALHLARQLGRPVRWVEDRAEAMLAGPRGRGQYLHTRLGADAGGRLLAYRLDNDADIGGYPHTGAMVPLMTAGMATGAYRTPLVGVRTRCVVTNTAPTTSYRGAGRPEAAFAVERTVDRLARRLGVDPVELRLRNFLAPEDFPYETPTGRTYDSGAYAAALQKALDAVGYDDLRREQARRREAGERPLGIGVATYVERSGGPPDSPEFASVEAHPDGSFVVRVGSTSTGQGHRTSFAQVAATVLEVDLDAVTVVQNDTREVAQGFATYGSRSMQIGGEAVHQAASGLVTLARERFATRHGVPVEEVACAGGELRAAELTSSMGDLAPLRVDRKVTPPQAFPFGAYVAVVEIDVELGVVELRQLVAVDDYGVVVNPLIVDGQGYGSIAQGLGQALTEEAVVGADGVPFARTLLDYLLPTAADVPEPHLLETRTPNPNTALGAKGAGEAGCIGVPPALVNAVCDALDVDHVDMPLTPERVWRAAHDRG